MASLSHSFSIDCIKGSANARSLTKNHRWLPHGYLNFTDYRNGYLKCSADNLGKCLRGRNDGCSSRILRSRSSRSCFAETGYARSSEEDALQETIEKSKKVLALQKEILVKISERKNLLHFIKNSITNPEDGEISFQDRENSHSYSDDTSKRQDISVSSGQDLGPKRVLTENDSSEIEQATRLSTDKDGLDLGPDEKTEEMSSIPTTKDSNIQYEGIVESPSKKVTDTLNNSISLAGDNVMNILFVAAECAPWSKTGGLGDVAAALPKALAQRGHRVMVVLPRYENYVEAQNTGIIRRYKVAGQDIEVSYYHTYIDGVDFVFIGCALFHGIKNDIYGGKREDVLKRMVLFCKAAIEVPWHVPCGEACYGDGNLVFIANDWHTALLPVYLKAYYQDNGLMSYARSVLVIHNIAHQGRGPVNEFSYIDLPEHYLDSFRLYDPLGGEHLNIFAAGLKAAHRIVTVSHGYAWELKTQEGGWGLHNIINENDWKLRGIVNGIDPNEWNPESDVYLKSEGFLNYSVDTLGVGKRKCKEALQRELNLPVLKDIPLIGFIGRLDDQKGVDIIGKSVPWMMEQNLQLVMLGMGRPNLEQMLRDFENEHHDRIRGLVGFSVKTAHRITAGVDILLMPSRFEPCGLNQLYAMRYGTVPVVHAVGGLKDTVLPYDPFNEAGYGWTFDRADSDKLKEALWNCLLTFRQYRQSWEGLQRRGMMQNLSWDHAAQMYEEVIVAAKYQW